MSSPAAWLCTGGGDDLLPQGSARALQKSDLEEEVRGIGLSWTWQSCVSKALKPPIYIGGGEGLALGLKGTPRAPVEGRRCTPTPIRFRKEESSSSFPPPSFPFFSYFPLVFSYVAPWAPWADSTSPLRTCGAMPVPWDHSRVGGPLPVNTRNPFVTPGTLPELPETFR